MKWRSLLVVAVLAVAVAGCGGSKKTNKSSAYPSSGATTTQASGSGNASQQDAVAKSNARELVTEVETCYVDQQTYAGCKKPTGTQLPIGSAPGQVEVTPVTATDYTVVAHSKSGTSFKVVKASGAATARSCDKPGQGGCPSGGSW
jgi:type IV pilus assembly protein PilA